MAPPDRGQRVRTSPGGENTEDSTTPRLGWNRDERGSIPRPRGVHGRRGGSVIRASQNLFVFREDLDLLPRRCDRHGHQSRRGGEGCNSDVELRAAACPRKSTTSSRVSTSPWPGTGGRSVSADTRTGRRASRRSIDGQRRSSARLRRPSSRRPPDSVAGKAYPLRTWPRSRTCWLSVSRAGFGPGRDTTMGHFRLCRRQYTGSVAGGNDRGEAAS